MPFNNLSAGGPRNASRILSANDPVQIPTSHKEPGVADADDG
jgi:hypothetical protein